MRVLASAVEMGELEVVDWANSLTSDFNGPNEKSFQVAYGIYMAEYGVPGLKFNIYSARGW